MGRPSGLRPSVSEGLERGSARHAGETEHLLLGQELELQKGWVG